MSSDVRRYVIQAVTLENRSRVEIAQALGISIRTVHNIMGRWRIEGEAAYEPRSRAPHNSPQQTPVDIEDAIVGIRKQLTDQGHDSGPATIAWHLTETGREPPSESTIWRILKRRGLTRDQPQKRPRSSWNRFEADLPNGCWQSDVTYWHLTNNHRVEILNILDDHSRYIVASVVFDPVRINNLIAAFDTATSKNGPPAAVLTDNGGIYTTRHLGGINTFETHLHELGITQKRSRPNHPQTCGKIERWHQTLKNWLTQQAHAQTLTQLQDQLDEFVDYYNHHRPHRALGRRTPAQAYTDLPKAQPADTPIGDPPRIRHDRVDTAGKITLRYKSHLYKIGLGRRFKHKPVTALINGTQIRILTHDGKLIRELELDPTRTYQPQSTNARSPAT